MHTNSVYRELYREPPKPWALPFRWKLGIASFFSVKGTFLLFVCVMCRFLHMEPLVRRVCFAVGWLEAFFGLCGVIWLLTNAINNLPKKE